MTHIDDTVHNNKCRAPLVASLPRNFLWCTGASHIGKCPLPKARGGRDRNAERQRRFTQRDPAGIEYAAMIDLTLEVQVPSSQPPLSQ